VPSKVLDPRRMWSDSVAYDQAAQELAARFQENFKQFASAPAKVRAAGPTVA
jgi:phosphoenolpyruvate carboxykinase (ATP)